MALISSFVFAVAIAVNNLTKALRFARPFAFSARLFFTSHFDKNSHLKGFPS